MQLATHNELTIPRELTDDVRETDPLWGVVAVELTDAQVEAVHSDFADDNALDLLGDLHSAARNAETALKFVRKWSEKLGEKEAEAAERAAQVANW